MEIKHPGGIDHRVLQNVRFNARRLFRFATVPGMDAADYEQDLVADLLHRQKSFNPLRASFATFADRVIGNRARTLATATARLLGERGWVSIAADVTGEGGGTLALVEQIADDAQPLEDAAIVSIDMARFVERLPNELVDICGVLLAPSISSGAREIGMHRSTAYDRIAELRRRAVVSGLAVYFEHSSDTLPLSPVCGAEGSHGNAGAGPELLSMKPGTRPQRTCLQIDERELRLWLSGTRAGDVLEYHRGVLAIDRLVHGSRLLDQDRRQLDRVANILFDLAHAGRGHLLQRRMTEGGFAYLFVYRPPPFDSRRGFSVMAEDLS